MDYDTLGFDDHIGTTIIDLDDRMFSEKWKNYNRDKGTMPSIDPPAIAHFFSILTLFIQRVFL